MLCQYINYAIPQIWAHVINQKENFSNFRFFKQKKCRWSHCWDEHFCLGCRLGWLVLPEDLAWFPQPLQTPFAPRNIQKYLILNYLKKSIFTVFPSIFRLHLFESKMISIKGVMMKHCFFIQHYFLRNPVWKFEMAWLKYFRCLFVRFRWKFNNVSYVKLNNSHVIEMIWYHSSAY